MKCTHYYLMAPSFFVLLFSSLVLQVLSTLNSSMTPGPPSGTPPTGTRPTQRTPSGTPPTGTRPTQRAPSGTPPTGTKPTQRAPSGTPPTGTRPTQWTRPTQRTPSGTPPIQWTIPTRPEHWTRPTQRTSRRTTTRPLLVKVPTRQPLTSTTTTTTIIAWLFGAVLVTMVALFVILAWRRKRKKRREMANEMTELGCGSQKVPWREIDKGFIATGKELGAGFFGVVLQGTVIVDGQSKQCAVKMLKPNATETDSKDLLNELRIIARIGGHPNIINLIGACTTSGPPRIVFEFAANGNLLEYLRKHRDETYSNMTSARPDINLDLRERLKIAYEVAQGMRHLSSKKCVHRDLAARNVLLDEHYVAKVTDFGLSRDVYEEGIYQISSQTKMPLKWMAIESLESMTFTTQSDVWSFAVLVWEIETGGATPYPGLMGREMFQELIAGHRLERPPSCPDMLYELMSKCWIREPSVRPSFNDLCGELESHLQDEAGYEDLTPSAQGQTTDAATTTTPE